MWRICSVALLVLSCGPKSIGEECTVAAKDCASPTSCIASGSRDLRDGGLTCDASRLLCSIPCAQDADCASLGAGHICVKDCAAGSCLKGTRR